MRFRDPTGFQGAPPEWVQKIKVVWNWAPPWLRGFLFEEGTRVIHIDKPHLGADFWHVNSDLKILQRLNHKNIEPLFAKLTLAKVSLKSFANVLAETKWLSVLERIPALYFPEFLSDPEYWMKQYCPECLEEDVG
jgi:hypothetical protein